MRFILTALVCLLAAGSATAVSTDRTEFSFTPLGTLLLDGATFAGGDRDRFHTGFAIPEVRLGGTARYGAWSAKAEIGFASNKVALKDVYFQYTIDAENCLRGGFQMHQFGYQNATAACQKITMIEPECNTVFNDVHMLGISYLHTGRKWFAFASLHTESAATYTTLGGTEGMSKQGFGMRTRLVAHPYTDAQQALFQIGVSAAFSTPHYSGTPGEGDTHDRFRFACNYPTRVNSVSALGVVVDESRNLWKVSPELLAGRGRVALESQFYYMRVNRLHGLRSFTATGAYANLRGIICGSDRYPYSLAAAGIGLPRPGTLEGVVSYNWTDLTDSRAGLRGGRLSDISLTLNYYINPYMTVRLRGGYTHTWDREGALPADLVPVQARLQLIF